MQELLLVWETWSFVLLRRKTDVNVVCGDVGLRKCASNEVVKVNIGERMTQPSGDVEEPCTTLRHDDARESSLRFSFAVLFQAELLIFLFTFSFLVRERRIRRPIQSSNRCRSLCRAKNSRRNSFVRVRGVRSLGSECDFLIKSVVKSSRTQLVKSCRSEERIVFLSRWFVRLSLSLADSFLNQSVYLRWVSNSDRVR